jgi:hypothetical protein
MLVCNCKGNVLIYVLIAVALLAALTYTIMGENRGQQQNQLSDAEIKLLATDLIKHAVDAEMAVQQMTQWGIDYDQILFDLPGTAGYSTNTTRQLFHPSGGGLQVFDGDKYFGDFPAQRGWRIANTHNVQWTSTTATDLIYSFLDVNEEICSEINRQLIGNPNILNNARSFNAIFNTPTKGFDSTDCTECVNIMKACVDNPTDDGYAYYNIIGSR